MIGFLYFVGILLLLVAFVFIGIIVYNERRELEEPRNQPLIENFNMTASKYSEGIVEDEEMKGNLIKIVFRPRDPDYIKALNDKEVIKKQTVFYLQKHVKTIPQGGHSLYRTKIKAYPSEFKYLPEYLKEGEGGKNMMKMLNEKSTEQDEADYASQRLKAMEKSSLREAGLEISDANQKALQEMIKSFKDNQPGAKKDE